MFSLEQQFTQAKDFQQAGHFAEALALFGILAKNNPHHARFQFEQGNLLNALAHSEQALDCYTKALALDENFPGLKNNLGNTWLDLGQPAKALQCFDEILAKQPQDANALNNRGTALRDLKQPELALVSYEKALAIAPNNVEALNNHGNQLLELNQPEQALKSYQRAYRLSPHFHITHRNAARALLAIHRPNEAMKLLDLALQTLSQDAFTWMYRGDALRQMQRFEEAIASYERALSIQPALDFLPGLKLYLKMQICDWNDWPQAIEDLKTALKEGRRYTVPMPMLGFLDIPALQLAASHIYMSGHTAPVSMKKESAVSPHLSSVKQATKKIKLGYFSAHFHEHPTGRLMAEIFERHDRSQFEVYAFSFGVPARDSVRQRLIAAFDEFIDVTTQSDEQVVRLSQQMGIDIAIDLTGYYDQSRPGLFARRCAPIQVSYLITPGTLGMSYWDYLIADSVVVPPASFPHFSEQIVHLPSCYFTFDSKQTISERIFTRKELGLPDDGFVFCCFNNSYKITPPVFDIWMRILHSAPDSVLWLFESNHSVPHQLKREATLRGIDPERLIFSKVAKLDEHLARQQLADLFLDTWPCNAHTTACDALFSGLPVLTHPGQSFASRVAASMLTTLNLPQLIAESPQAYESMALEYANQPSRLVAMREQLLQSRHHSPLFSGAIKARELESAYIAMTERQRKGLDPAHFQVARC